MRKSLSLIIVHFEYRAFNLEEDEGLMLYLDSLFSHDSFGSTTSVARKLKLSKATATINNIKVKENLLGRLKSIYEYVSKNIKIYNHNSYICKR